MKKIIHTMCLTTLIYLSLSCGDTKEDSTPMTDYSAAIQLKIGNYWVYDYKTILLASNEVSQQLDDSTFINRDTIINGSPFAIMENPYGLFQLKRDSLGYVVDEKNNIDFSATNFKDTIYKSPPFYGLMKEKEELIEVPAGKFNAISFVVIERDSNHNHNHNPNDPTVYENSHTFKLVSRTWYAKEIGIVQSVFYFGNSVAYERKLKKYKINK